VFTATSLAIAKVMNLIENGMNSAEKVSKCDEVNCKGEGIQLQKHVVKYKFCCIFFFFAIESESFCLHVYILYGFLMRE